MMGSSLCLSSLGSFSDAYPVLLRSVKICGSCATCSFWSCNMSHLDSLVFTWRRRVFMGEAAKTSPCPRCQSRLPCHLRGMCGTWWFSHVWHFVISYTPQFALVYATLDSLHFSTFALHTPSTLYTSHLTLDTVQSTFTLHIVLYTWHSTLYTPHFI